MSSSAANNNVDEVVESAQAATNGASPVRELSSPFSLQTAMGVAYELGFGLVAVGVSAGAATYSVNRFIAAYRLVRS